MLDNWRHFLYFALGFLPTLFFGARFALQWIQSERNKTSSVSSLFWKLSIAGNILLSIHYFLQFQYQFLLIQAINSFIAWRNIHYIKRGVNPIPFKRALLAFGGILCGILLLCLIQNHYTSFSVKLLQAPVGLLGADKVSYLWHIFGLIGGLLFASRWWLQGVWVERSGVSRLTKGFWILSVVGSLSALIYFIRILDWVNIVSYSVGLIPYIRNLMLMRRVRQPGL